MSKSLRFQGRLLVPEPKRAKWTFVLLPKSISQKLPTRGQVPVLVKLNESPFRGLLEPDGRRGHWFQFLPCLLRKAGLEPGESGAFELLPSEHEVPLPSDLRKSLVGASEARATWKTLTPAARRDWIHWITSAKQKATRLRRIATTCDMLASGKRRVCCFDRSGAFSNSLASPRIREG